MNIHRHSYWDTGKYSWEKQETKTEPEINVFDLFVQEINKQLS